MKILVLGKYPLSFFGGLERVARDWCLAFRDSNFVDAVIYLGNQRSHLDRSVDIDEKLAKVDFHFGTQPISFRFVRLFFHNIVSCDVVHVHLPNILSAFLTLVFVRKAKILLHWHSDVLNKGFFLEFVSNFILYFLCLRADRIIATSENYAKSSIILKNFLNKTLICPITLKSSRHLDLSFRQDNMFILSVGRLVDYKGFNVLIRSMVYIDPKISLVIVGDGPLRSELVALIQYLGLEGRVSIKGSVSDVELNVLMEECFAFILNSNSRAEAFGVVLIEAMACSKPLLTSNLNGSGVTFVNVHNETGLFHDYSDVFSIASNVNLLHITPDFRDFLARNSFERFENTFSARVLPDYVQEVLSDLK